MLFFIMTVSVIQRFQSKTKTETQSNILLFVIGSVVNLYCYISISEKREMLMHIINFSGTSLG